MLYNRILGGLIGAAAGDAMGAATETRTRNQIRQRFCGYVTDFITPPMDTFARGNTAGQVTDDFSLAYFSLKNILDAGTINHESLLKGLLEWASIPKYFDRFAGPTTRAMVKKIKGEVPDNTEFVPVNDNRRASNGAAMKASPIALLSKGDIDKAIKYAIEAGIITHPNNIALSGAAAIAAATAAAMREKSTIVDIVEASIYGAQEGDKFGRINASTLAGASVETRIRWAVSLASEAPDLKSAVNSIGDYIGSGLMTVEAVPAAIGICVAAGGNVVQGICAAVNIGDDTDTVATMVGGILGTFNGAEAIPEKYMDIIERANGFDLKNFAKRIGEFEQP